MSLIEKYTNGSDITVMNITYFRPQQMEDGSYDKDRLLIMYKDNETKKKHFKMIEEPNYTYYIRKDEFKKPYSDMFVDMSELEPVEVPFRRLKTDTYKKSGITNYTYGMQVKLDPNIYGSDIDILSYYRALFSRSYLNTPTSITKGYLDIEVDVKDCIGGIPTAGEYPINAISYLDDNTHTLYTFTVRDENNPEVAKYEEYAKYNDINISIQENLAKCLGSKEAVDSFGLSNLKVVLVFFDSEEEMLKAIFDIIHKLSPDFVMSWNMRFDIPYIIGRLKYINMDPNVIMSDPDCPIQAAGYYEDKMHDEFSERCDYGIFGSRTVYIDQLVQFASRRKGQRKFASYTLDYIGGLIAGATKLDYSKIASFIGDLPYIDFKTFIEYNMIDVIVQKCIEDKCSDIEYLFTKSIDNDTPYQKCHRQTVYLTNKYRKFLRKMNKILFNNPNTVPEVKESYPGGFVADPKLLSDKSRVKINGRPTMLTGIANDFDYKRLYPSIMQEFNICPNGQIGRIIIPDPVFPNENRIRSENYKRETAFMEDSTCGDPISFFHRWFNLASYEEMVFDIREYVAVLDLGQTGTYLNTGRIEIATMIENHNIERIVLDKPKEKKRITIATTVYPMDEEMKNERDAFCNTTK